jgi:hypothetical protein
VTLAVFKIGFCISRTVFLDWMLLLRSSISEELATWHWFAEMAVYFRHTAQHHIPKDNVDNLKSLKFNIIFLLHTVTVYLNYIITKCGCVIGILALCLVTLKFRSQCGDRLS